MNVQNRSDFNEVLNEIRDTRNGVHVFGELNRELLFDIRTIAQEIRLILCVILCFIILAVMLFSSKFIYSGFLWLIEHVRFLKDFDLIAAHEYAPLFYIIAIINIFLFLVLFFVKATSHIFKERDRI